MLRNARSFFHCSLFTVLLLVLGGISCARAATDQSLVLIASPDMRDEVYGSSVLAVRALPDGSHVGIILNKPMEMELGAVLPDGTSYKVSSTVYLGGADASGKIFALVAQRVSPGANAIQMAPNLYLVTDAESVEKIIASGSGQARYFLGVTTWGPGQLKDEMKRGLWYPMRRNPGSHAPGDLPSAKTGAVLTTYQGMRHLRSCDPGR
jgi:putative transcriptional regulator